MTTYRQDTESVEDSDAREGVEFAYGVVRHRVAFSRRTIVIDGKTYTAYPSQRQELRVAAVMDDDELVISMPVAHPLVQRWLVAAAPPRGVTATVVRKEAVSGETQTIYRGSVTSVSLDGDVARLHCPARISVETSRGVPSITIGRQCPHVLYSPPCGVDRSAYVKTATVVEIAGAKLRLSISPTNDFTGGELVHVTSQEKMTIARHTGTYFTMQMPLYGLQLGDLVEVAPGCPHDVASCFSLYDNVLNFGGFPALPKKSIVLREGLGVFEKE